MACSCLMCWPEDANITTEHMGKVKEELFTITTLVKPSVIELSSLAFIFFFQFKIFVGFFGRSLVAGSFLIRKSQREDECA